MKIIIQPDIAKAKSLINISKVTLDRLNETEMEKYPSNTLKDYYDIIKGLMEALLYIEGVKMKGESAHYETIEHVCKKYNFAEASREFLQGMRDYRNRISYEGFNVQPNYIKQNKKKINSIIESLLKLVNEKLNSH